MDSFTPLQKSDIPEIAQLFQKIFRRSTSPPPPELGPYFEKIYLNNPWQDDSITSLVFKSNGKVAGFLGVMPFSMSLKGKPIRAAIGGNFMIDPAVANALAGPRLLKKFLSGPQDLSYTDTATEQGKKMLEGLGATAIPLYSQQWLRVIRPIEFTLKMGRRNKVAAPLAILARPVSYLIDSTLAVIPNSPFRQEKADLQVVELSARDLLEAIRSVSSSSALAPEYTEQTLAWLLTNAGEKMEYGPLRKIAIYTKDHKLQGWFLYYPNAGDLGHVLQVGTYPRTTQAVLSHLFTDARMHGSLALAGRLEPKYMVALSTLNCIFMHRNSSLVVHSANPDIMNALHRGDAFFTRLEGEWWTRLQGDTFKEDR
jgi:hypothetical protein